ncbi:MAG: hypothetical protein M1829_003605 [Trizodia sp. TS-e1964]|nr:MAG: hypothetical protein M1829_003605 [Trizodia sp. TS-e1964]
MADREERTHKNQDVDFGLTFGNALAPALPPQRSSRSSRLSGPQEPLLQLSIKKTPMIAPDQGLGEFKSSSASLKDEQRETLEVDSDRSSAKRRKLSAPATTSATPARTPTTPHRLARVSSNTRSSRATSHQSLSNRRGQKDIFEFQADEPPHSILRSISSSNGGASTHGSALKQKGASSSARQLKGTTVSSRSRNSIEENSFVGHETPSLARRNPLKERSNVSSFEVAEDSLDAGTKSTSSRKRGRPKKQFPTIQEQEEEEEEEGEEAPGSIFSDPPPRAETPRKLRSAAIAQDATEDELGEADTSRQQAQITRKGARSSRAQYQIPSDKEDEDVGKENRLPQAENKRKVIERLRSEADINESDEPIEDDEIENILSSPLKKGKKKASSIGNQTQNPRHSSLRSQDQSQDSQIADDEPAPRRSRRGPAKEYVPITVHRIPKHLLPDDEDDEDPISRGSNFFHRGGVNAVDVLAQLCKETIDKIGESMLATGDENAGGKRAENHRKRKVVEAFGLEVGERCFELTEALDTNFVLHQRLRQSQKQKLALREELLQIRAEREKVAFQMDEVRARHEAETTIAQGRSELNDAIYDIELAVKRGTALQEEYEKDPDAEPMPMVGLEALILSTTADVSSLSEGGGILRQARDFNAFLERALAVLEGRS